MENIPLPSQQPVPNLPVSSEGNLSPEPIKPHGKLKKILIGIGVIILLAGSGFGYLFYTASKISPELEKIATNFLTLVSNNSFDSAYSLTSQAFKNEISKEDFVLAMTSAKAQYSGFGSLKQTGFFVSAETGRATIYEFSGIVTYTDQDKGNLQAQFVKENGEWKILYVSIDVKISRLNKFK